MNYVTMLMNECMAALSGLVLTRPLWAVTTARNERTYLVNDKTTQSADDAYEHTQIR